jgi:hypothetical protein
MSRRSTMAQFVPCPGCQRHVRTTEQSCPFCSVALSLENTPAPVLPATRLGRYATFAFGATLVGATALAACGGQSEDSDDGSGKARGGANNGGSKNGGTKNGGNAGTNSGGTDNFGGGMAVYGGPPIGGTTGAGGTTGTGGVAPPYGIAPPPDAGLDSGLQPPYGFPPDDGGGAQPEYGAPPSDGGFAEDGGGAQPDYGTPPAPPRDGGS